jgi:WD40 repeat protein
VQSEPSVVLVWLDWDTANGMNTVTFPSCPSDPFNRKKLCPNGKILAVETTAGILLYRLDKYLNALEDPKGDVVATDVAPDGPRSRKVATSSSVATRFGRTPSTTLKGHKGPIWHLAFSPDSRILASTSNNDANIRLWDVETGTNIQTLKHQGYRAHVAFSPYGNAGNVLASKHERDNVVELWDLPSERERRSGSNWRAISASPTSDTPWCRGSHSVDGPRRTLVGGTNWGRGRQFAPETQDLTLSAAQRVKA